MTGVNNSLEVGATIGRITQLGLENAPDGNGKEQTVRSLIFAPMLHVMSETNANDCHTCVVCASDVLDNNLFCSTCAGISFEVLTILTTVMFLKHKPVLTMFWMTVENFRSGGVLEISSRIGWEFVGC